MKIFKKAPKLASQNEEQAIRISIQKRAEVNAEARQMATKMVVSKGGGDILSKIDQILDKVAGFENSKITAITELYLALESGDTKNLTAFLKKSDSVGTKKTKKTWKS